MNNHITGECNTFSLEDILLTPPGPTRQRNECLLAGMGEPDFLGMWASPVNVFERDPLPMFTDTLSGVYTTNESFNSHNIIKDDDKSRGVDFGCQVQLA